MYWSGYFECRDANLIEVPRTFIKGLIPDATLDRLRRVRAAWELAQERDFLLVNSHMRSYSSLLGHILAASGEVCGYTEMRRSYRAEADLLALTWQVRSSHGARLRGSVVLDKLLHASHTIDDVVLQKSNVRVLLSVRAPEPTLRSIVAMGIGIDPNHHWSVPQHATEHYVERLDSLVELAQRADRPIVLNADAVVDAPDAVLGPLQHAIGLTTPLQTDYETRSLTGTAEFGDTSTYIRSGSIVTDRDPHDQIQIDPALLEAAVDAHARFWTAMNRLDVEVIGTNPVVI